MTKKNLINIIIKLRNMISDENGNMIRFRIIYGFCFVVHTFYAILFGLTGVTELMIFNIISSVMYASGIVVARFEKVTPVLVFLISAEIMTHCFLCSFYIGSGYQFMLYSVSILPVTYFVTYLDPAFRHPMITSSMLGLVNFLVLVASPDYSSMHPPLYAFGLRFMNSVARLNIMFSTVILVSFSMMFIAKINYDMNKLKRQNDKLDYLANYDQLTGLRNRNHIRDIFESYIKSTDPYCVILGDIDDFKRVNDTYGHSAGDEVLKKVSEIIKKNVGDKGEVCRWGGEEILIIVKGTAEECLELNEKILYEIRGTTINSRKYGIKVTMTFGLCDYSDEMDIEKLISLADKRLYMGKRNGKNRIVSKS